jgi:hypothetical protein
MAKTAAGEFRMAETNACGAIKIASILELATVSSSESKLRKLSK